MTSKFSKINNKSRGRMSLLETLSMDAHIHVWLVYMCDLYYTCVALVYVWLDTSIGLCSQTSDCIILYIYPFL